MFPKFVECFTEDSVYEGHKRHCLPHGEGGKGNSTNMVIWMFHEKVLKICNSGEIVPQKHVRKWRMLKSALVGGETGKRKASLK